MIHVLRVGDKVALQDDTFRVIVVKTQEIPGLIEKLAKEAKLELKTC